MLCQECRKRPATVKFTMVVNGQKVESHLCEECYHARGDTPFFTEPKLTIQNLVGSLLEHWQSLQEAPAGAPRCDTCGMTFDQFRQVGRFGCPDCYRYFDDWLDPLLRRIHGSPAHKGKVPARSGGTIRQKREIGDLREELERCVAREDFERAAVLRDRIRELERGLSDKAGKGGGA